MSLPVTIVIPVKNEAVNLPACLASCESTFHQVVVVDSGSTDETPEIAKKSNAILLDFKWDGHFPKKRNWVLRNYLFDTPWVLFLDADERITKGFIDELGRRLPHTTMVGFWIRYNNWFIDRPMRHGDPFRKLALMKVGSGEYEQYPEDSWSILDMEVHEHPVLDGDVGIIDSPLEHHDFKGIAHYRAKHRAYAEWEAKRFMWLNSSNNAAWAQFTSRQRFKYCHLDKWWLSWIYFIMTFVFKRGFLDGYAGLRFALEKKRYFANIRTLIRKVEP